MLANANLPEIREWRLGPEALWGSTGVLGSKAEDALLSQLRILHFGISAVRDLGFLCQIMFSCPSSGFPSHDSMKIPQLFLKRIM